MNESIDQYDRHFTLEEANAMLPLVKAIVADISHLYLDLVQRQQRLEHLMAGREKQEGDPYVDELEQIEKGVEVDRGRLREYVEELSQLGIECKDPSQGLIDFPAKIDGREVFLCWKLDEPEVLFWHDIDAGFAGRQALAAGAGIGENSDKNSFEV